MPQSLVVDGIHLHIVQFHLGTLGQFLDLTAIQGVQGDVDAVDLGLCLGGPCLIGDVGGVQLQILNIHEAGVASHGNLCPDSGAVKDGAAHQAHRHTVDPQHLEGAGLVSQAVHVQCIHLNLASQTGEVKLAHLNPAHNLVNLYLAPGNAVDILPVQDGDAGTAGDGQQGLAAIIHFFLHLDVCLGSTGDHNRRCDGGVAGIIADGLGHGGQLALIQNNIHRVGEHVAHIAGAHIVNTMVDFVAVIDQLAGFDGNQGTHGQMSGAGEIVHFGGDLHGHGVQDHVVVPLNPAHNGADGHLCIGLGGVGLAAVNTTQHIDVGACGQGVVGLLQSADACCVSLISNTVVAVHIHHGVILDRAGHVAHAAGGSNAHRQGVFTEHGNIRELDPAHVGCGSTVDNLAPDGAVSQCPVGVGGEDAGILCHGDVGALGQCCIELAAGAGLLINISTLSGDLGIESLHGNGRVAVLIVHPNPAGLAADGNLAEDIAIDTLEGGDADFLIGIDGQQHIDMDRSRLIQVMCHLGDSGVALEGGNHVVEACVVILTGSCRGRGKLGIQLHIVHAHPAALDVTPIEAIDLHNLGDVDTAAQRSHANQCVGGTGCAADVHAGGAVDNGASHAVAGAGAGAIAIGGADNGNIVQVNPALVDEAPCHAANNFLAHNHNGGAGCQSSNLRKSAARSGPDVQAHGAADHGRAAGGDVAAAGLRGLIQGDISHGNPALVDVTPGSAIDGGLLINGDLGALVQLGSQRVGDTGSSTDIDLGCTGNNAGGAAGESRIRRSGCGAVVVGVGQENPALTAVAPAAGAVQHGNGGLLIPLEGTHLGCGGVGLLADGHIVIGNGDRGGGNDGGHVSQVVAQLHPAAGGQLQPLGGANHLLCHNGNGGIPADFINLIGITGSAVHVHHAIIGNTHCLVDDISGQSVICSHLVIGALLPASHQGLAGGSGTQAGHQSGIVVPAQEGIAAPGRIAGKTNLIIVRAAEHLNQSLGTANEAGILVVARKEHGIAQRAGAGGAVGAGQVQVCHCHPALNHVAGAGIIGEAAGIIPGTQGVGKLGSGAAAGNAVLNGIEHGCVGGPGSTLTVGVPHQSIEPLLNQLDAQGVNHLHKLVQFCPQQLIGIGLGDGLVLHGRGAITHPINACGNFISIPMEAHEILNHPNAGLADTGGCCRSGNCRNGNQADDQNKCKHQASNSLFHRKPTPLHRIVSYWYYNSIGYKLQPLKRIFFTICNFYFWMAKAPHFIKKWGAFAVHLLWNCNFMLSNPDTFN